MKSHFMQLLYQSRARVPASIQDSSLAEWPWPHQARGLKGRSPPRYCDNPSILSAARTLRCQAETAGRSPDGGPAHPAPSSTGGPPQPHLVNEGRPTVLAQVSSMTADAVLLSPQR